MKAGMLLLLMATFADVGVDEHRGAVVPLDAPVRDESGRSTSLRRVVDGTTPIVLVLAYYSCPMLCDRVLTGLATSLRDARLSFGADYRVVAISFDPRDTPEVARAKSDELLASLSAFEQARWRLLVDDRGSAAAIARAVGVKYSFDEPSGQYSHAAVVVVLSPAGRVAQYLYGITFTPATLSTALDEARTGRQPTTVERVLVRCFQYVPSLQRHAKFVAGFLRIGTLATFLALTATVVWLVRRQQHPGSGA